MIVTVFQPETAALYAPLATVEAWSRYLPAASFFLNVQTPVALLFTVAFTAAFHLPALRRWNVSVTRATLVGVMVPL